MGAAGPTETNGFLARLGAAVLFILTLLHPMREDLNDAAAAFAEYAADTLWVWSQLGQFMGSATLGIALAALAGTFE